MTDEIPVPQSDPDQEAVLEAARQGITDPEEIRKFAGLPTLAAVKRTIDKLTIRREYHEALAKNGVSMDWLVAEIKKLVDYGKTDNVRLAALKTLMGSVGLNKFDDVQVQGKDWEETLIRISSQQDPANAKAIEGPDKDYEVIVPKRPKSVSAIREAEDKLVREMFHQKP